ncbi:MAG: short-chain dehydrogenase, partial [Steroidobacteraceae bacterium]
QSADVTGVFFDLEGGRITLANGWNDGPTVDKGARWRADELGPVVAKLMAERPAQKKVWGT